MHFEVEFQKQHKNNAIQDGVTGPGSESIAAAAFEKMQKKNADMGGQIQNQHYDLAIHHQWETGVWQTYRRPELVPINYGVKQGREKNGQYLERLRKFKPEKRLEYYNWLSD